MNRWSILNVFEAYICEIILCSQIIARYNFERFSNGMERVKPFVTLREPISEAYFPKMNSLVTSRAWPARAANTQLSDLNRELDQIKSDVTDLETWVERFAEACNDGYAKAVCITLDSHFTN